jgi:hypothetical protein
MVNVVSSSRMLTDDGVVDAKVDGSETSDAFLCSHKSTALLYSVIVVE